jgi:hypothetical protein
MADPKIAIVVVVNGEPTTVEANPNTPLHTIIPRALAATGNVGQPPENWELRDADGNVVDTDQKIESYGWGAGIRLFLSLKAGIGG